MSTTPLAQQPPPTQYFKKGFGLKAVAQGLLARDYHSHIVEYLRAHDFTLRIADMEIHLAQEFGFCYGVDRAVEYAYQTREKFPDRRIFLTGEIIHNPHVNRRLLEMGINFLSGQYSNGVGMENLTSEDVVILPAFGVTMNEFKHLSAIGCILVDTTCGSVLNVWKRVEQYARDGFTAVIHGKYYHEETKATASQATKYPEGHYLVVRNMEETERVCDFIMGKLHREEFLALFSHAISAGFDPDLHLRKIGVANQTTMLSSESLAIAERLKQAMIARFGAVAIDEHFRTFDTICSATQDRQDAVIKLVNSQNLDMMLVIGGYNSSNTNHLAALASKYVKTYHLDDPRCLVSAETIRHKPFGQNEEIETHGWLPAGPIKIGLTAGASTPNNKIGEAISRLAGLRGVNLESAFTPNS
ncbi:MAG: 4-hydroxy-3-methylbut-2-enyl diphosphate reductase [candidate division KSB1 bacterium]|nr:4-hydroxy-3-methylbut-2-enyl diphosphate reductase [candidate division KSB1 bacterium]MDZ7303882.1 4-hydroxy-3-methylbut-2-enyl diphosphate reductase [candidate division KSB1 bacterium]MDZ7313194.1 4-hydroxy-3-methylbut-2-enyl diphosphate reductase [candidate division KSB1 bacterium]